MLYPYLSICLPVNGFFSIWICNYNDYTHTYITYAHTHTHIFREVLLVHVQIYLIHFDSAFLICYIFECIFNFKKHWKHTYFIICIGKFYYLKLLLVSIKSEQKPFWVEHLGCSFFPFITLSILCYALLACRVSA